MNKKAQNTAKWIIVALVIGIAIYFFAFYQGQVSWKPLSEHKDPADLSEQEKGTGIQVRIWDKNGNPVEVPSWFKVSTTGVIGAVMRHPGTGETTCTALTDCPGCSSGTCDNPHVLCYDLDDDETKECVLSDLGSFALDFRVTAGDIDYSDVHIVSATTTPTIWRNAFPVTTISSLDRETVHTFRQNPFLFTGGVCPVGETCVDGTSLEDGLQRDYTVNVEGTRKIGTGTDSAGDTVTLVFDLDPTGGLSVKIMSVV